MNTNLKLKLIRIVRLDIGLEQTLQKIPVNNRNVLDTLNGLKIKPHLIKIVLSIFMLLVVFTLQAQSLRVSGTVKDSNSPLLGASVIVKGTTINTITNSEGKYVIDVPSGRTTLVFSFVGYAPEEVSVNNRTEINVELKEYVQELEEQVIIGYGSGKRLGTVVGSVSVISGSVIKDKPTSNVLESLQGRVAGLQVYTSSGEPSATSSIRLHGIGSLGASNTPLYVLDGVPIDNGSIQALNPNDFESITLLKDASATSIYGSRAANGVLYITTKKGSLNKNATITFNGQYGISSIANTTYFDGFMNSKQLTDFWVETGRRTREQVDELLEEFPYDTKWFDYYYKDNVPTYQGDLSIRGGGGKTSYYVSGSFYHADGVAYRSYHDRYTFRANIESRAKDWLKFGLNSNISYSKRNTNGWGTNNTNRGLFWLTQPFYTPINPETGKLYDYIPGANKYGPWYLADKNPVLNNDIQLNAIGFVEITPFDGLILRSQAGVDGYDQRVSSSRLPSYLGSLDNGALEEVFYRNSLITVTNTAEYKFSVTDIHQFKVLAGHEFITNDYTSFSASSAGQTDDRLMLLGNGPNSRNVGHSHTQYAYLSWFGSLDYSLQDKYFATLTLRNDLSSRFGKNNRSAIFYSAGLLWNVKKESFLENIDLFTDLRVHATYGTTGNSSIGDYTHLATIGTNQYDGDVGWGISSPGNPNLTWEKQSLFSISIDAELSEKYRITLEYYDRRTKNMLMSVPYPYTSGFSEVSSNVGELKNSGIDITLDFDIVNNKDWLVNFNTTFNYNANKIVELFQGRSQWTVANTGVSYVVGKPVMFYYPLYAGPDPADGRQTWYLPNSEDNSVTTKDPQNITKTFNASGLEQNTGKPRYAPVAGGFGLEVAYKGLSVSSYFAYTIGKYLINNDRYFSANPANFAGYNQHVEVLDYWKKEGDIVSFPKYGEIRQFDDHLLEDASFLRFKTLIVSYTLPSSFLKKTKLVDNLRIFAVGRNLFTSTKYLGPDPEVDSNLTYGVYPNTKQYSAGIEITF
jgi:TonB-linked SusC/RagA family outer membrane protein